MSGSTERCAIVTGASGQDGAYLCELLLSKGYKVIGTYRPSSGINFWRLDELAVRQHTNLRLVPFSATGLAVCQELLKDTDPDEIYNLGGQSSAVTSVEQPLDAALANGMAAVYFLEAIRLTARPIRFFQAGSSELFGEAQEVPQVETTPFSPTSPYGVAKLFAHWSVVNYRQTYGVFAASGILFNHESPFRGTEFVTRKIAKSFARIKLGMQTELELGNMNSQRDWGYAKDFVEGMWASLQASEADTFVFATNRMHTVRDFVTLAARAAGFELHWTGEGERETGFDSASGTTLVRINRDFYRPVEIHQRIGNPKKAFEKLRWQPTTSLSTLCHMMVDAEIRRLCV
jgi:GDPmannose 4,6-dehydratase